MLTQRSPVPAGAAGPAARPPRPCALPRPRRAGSVSGFSLLEILVAAAVVGLMVAAGVGPISNWVAGLRVEMAAAEVAGALQMARLYAARSNVKVAVKFRTDPGGEVTWALYRDGDGDGVRNRDIDRGIDPLELAPRPLARLGKDVYFGFPPGEPPRDPAGRRLTRLDDPIRFNRSDLASFSPRGTSTPGTVYLTDGRYHLAAARVNNRAGKVSVLRYDRVLEVWR